MGFFQSLKQDLSEAVDELIGEEGALEDIENAEDAESDVEGVEEVAAESDEEAAAETYEAEELPEEIDDEQAEEYVDVPADESLEEIEKSADFLKANSEAELDALLKGVMPSEEESVLADNMSKESMVSEMPADAVDAEAAAMALFDSLSAEEGPSFMDDSNEVDLAEKLAEEAYKAEMLAEEDALQANIGGDVNEPIASLDDIDINKMLENIQGELNAVQEESLQAESLPDVNTAPEVSVENAKIAESDIAVDEIVANGVTTDVVTDDVTTVDESTAAATAGVDSFAEAAADDDDMLEGQMSLEEMMAMAEALTNEKNGTAQTENMDHAAVEAKVTDTAENILKDASESVVAENPVAEAPVAEAPVAEAPVAEAPIAEAPVAEAPVAEAPVAEAPVAEAPVAEAPVATDAALAAEAVMADFNAEVASELQNEEAASEPAKEKKAKKTSRKKKVKTDVSADIGVEELAGRVFSDETAHLSDGMTIRGNIISDGNMEVAGMIDGNIDILGKLNVSGTINGNTKAGEIYAEGAEINGNIECSGSVKVGQGAVIIGDIAGTSAVIAGAVKGNIDVHGPVILADSAIVMGDIRSASVQISNGAAVEGMCSQVYAEVSPKNFFKDLKKARQ